MEITNLHSHSP